MRAVLKRLVSVIAYASLTATIIATPVLIENAVASAATCGSGATMNFVAHEDDDLFFQSPNLLNDDQGRHVPPHRLRAGGRRRRRR